jgi:hypothetical protein
LAERKRGRGERRQGAHVYRAQLPTALLDPCTIVLGQESTARDVHGNVGGNQGTLPFLPCDSRLSVVNCSCRNLHVDVRVVIERETQRPVCRERVASDHGAELREQSAHCLTRRRRALFSPDRRSELLPPCGAVPVIYEPRKCNPTLGSGQLARQLSSSGSHDETPTQLYDHIGDNIDMAKRIVCECGYIIRAEDDKQIVELGREHMQANHPAIAAVITTKELLAMAEEE